MKKSLPLLLIALRLFLLGSLVPGSMTLKAQKNYPAVSAKFRELYNRKQADSLFSMYSPKVQAVLPLDKTEQMLEQLHTQFGTLDSVTLIGQEKDYARYKAAFDHTTLMMVLALDTAGKIDGLRFMPYTPVPAAGAGQPSSGKRAGRSDLSLKTTNGTIYGTLQVPAIQQRFPIVLIIAGSGPTDRDGNSTMGVRSDAYRLLADSLQRYGIATLRYDKRGIGESIASMQSESSLRFDDMIRDATGFVTMLKADDRFSKVIVLGHSEGSLIGMVAASDGKADAYISLAGAGDRIDRIIERQLTAQSPQLAAKARILFDSLVAGHPVQEPGSELVSLFRPSIQPYMISWLKYDPRQEIKKLKIPVLILQGTTDLQVSEEDAWQLQKGAPAARLQFITGMNHILKQASADRQENFATYTKPELPLSPALLEAIRGFIK